MNRRARSLSRRLVLAAAVWILLGLSVSGFVLSYAFEQAVRTAFEDTLLAQLRAVTAALKVNDGGEPSVADPLNDVRYRQVMSGWYWQITAPDGLLVRSRSLWDETLPPVPDAALGRVGFYDLPGPRGQKLRAAATLVNRDNADDMLIIAAADTAPLNAQLTRFNRITIMALGTLGLGLALAVVLQVVFGLKPLKRLAAELNEIRDGRRERLSQDQPREVASLAAALNDVLTHDQETLAKTRREVGNLAHSLKTPLAKLAANLDVVQGEDRKHLMQNVSDLRAKIDFYAARAATAAARGMTARRVGVKQIVADIVAALSKIHAESPKSVSFVIPEALTVLAEDEDITEMIGNLLDNAFKWAKSRIAVSAAAGLDGAILIGVEDDGPGVPPVMRAEILKGRRLDETVPGSGLGLQVVQDIAQAYGGSLELDQSALGGLRVAVRFPEKRGSGSLS